MKTSKLPFIPLTIAAALVISPMAAFAQSAGADAGMAAEISIETVSMERVIGALNNPPALSDVESFDGTAEVFKLSNLQGGITDASIGDIQTLLDDNQEWLTELHTAFEANSTLTAVTEDADVEVDQVIALSPAENGGWLIIVDDESALSGMSGDA